MDVEWPIAERPGKVKTLKQHPRKNKTAINIEYMKASIRARVEHPFRIIKWQFGFVKARYKGLLKTITNWRCYSPWPTCFGGPNDTSVGEISLKTGDNALNGEETV